ncbi:hypothetical protein DSL92_04055 [Billgrantia gudaonensis]|uniref:Uncharacterized protein n=1 Tax=Billgrantia gudaonensis TaxID=376427 RepID=A0A432JKP1_9GAMM|nr:hypothetical protein DSL92_04055 [Halomonas gudaonensis]
MRSSAIAGGHRGGDRPGLAEALAAYRTIGADLYGAGCVSGDPASCSRVSVPSAFQTTRRAARCHPHVMTPAELDCLRESARFTAVGSMSP